MAATAEKLINAIPRRNSVLIATAEMTGAASIIGVNAPATVTLSTSTRTVILEDK